MTDLWAVSPVSALGGLCGLLAVSAISAGPAAQACLSNFPSWGLAALAGGEIPSLLNIISTLANSHLI